MTAIDRTRAPSGPHRSHPRDAHRSPGYRGGGLSEPALRAADGGHLRRLLVVADRAVGGHELAEDEPDRHRTWVGFDNFVAVITDPELGPAVVNTVYFAVLALLFGFPLPLMVAVLMSEVRRGKGLYSALAYLPVVIPPVVAVLLWKFFYDAGPTGVFNTDPRLGGHRAAAVAPGRVAGDAVARARGHVGGGRRHRSSSTSPRCCRVPPELYDAAEVDGASIWRKVWHVTLPQLRGVLFIMLILQIIATAQVFLEPFLFTGGGPANATMTILLLIYRLRVPEQPGRRLRRGDGAESACSRSSSPSFVVYFRLTRPLEHLMTTRRPRRRSREGYARRPGIAAATSVGALEPARGDDSTARLDERSIVSAFERRRPGMRCGVADPRAAARAARRRRSRSDAVAGKVRRHAHAGHPAHPYGALAERHRLGEPRRRRGTTSRSMQLLLQHDLVIALGLVAHPAVHRDDRPGTRCRCCGPRTRRCSTRSCSATLFIPAVVLLVPLYLTIVNPPLLGTSR